MIGGRSLRGGGRDAADVLMWMGAGLLLSALLAAGILGNPLPLAVPGGIAFVALAVYYPRYVLLSCVALVPLSTEVQIGSIGTDFPLEPVLITAAGLAALHLIRNAGTVPAAAVRHPVSLLLVAHVAWIGFTAYTSIDQVISLKFFLAKLWYVLPWYVLGGLWLSRVRDVRTVVRWLAPPLAIALAYSVIRHAALDFSLEEIKKAMGPFFRNHVAYAALPSITLPFVGLGALLFPRRSVWRYALLALSLLMVFAVQTSYTRAAYVSIVAGVGYAVVMHLRLARPALLLAASTALALSVFAVTDNNFLRFTPDYNKTITHTDFESLVEATYKLEDISTMERVYRWVAAGYMTAERPLVGFGPGTFPHEYRGYAIEAFRTYISDNREGSGVHSYYLMTLAEQGYAGLAIFLALCILSLAVAERVYHRATSREERLVILMAASSLVINLSFQIINDLLETDKSGPWFFYAIAILVAADLRQRRPGQRRLGSGASDEGP